MQIFLVGGAVRDQLLGLPVKERDWVVVGATPEQMIALGFQPVGKEFPVFLHPKTKEEYALARTERKTGKGYKGFIFFADESVSLEQDLLRRDLTINAMALGEDGNLSDPYCGLEDLQKKVLHHVSPAFAEDPVRILRLARFTAKFPDFEIHPETLQLMQQMVVAGEVDALVAERVWQELKKSLVEKAPERFWLTLESSHALAVLFPALQLNQINLGSLQKAIQNSDAPEVRFAALMHALSLENFKDLASRYRLPNEFNDLTILVIKWFAEYERLWDLAAEEIWFLLKAVDALRRPERFQQFLLVCEACESDEMDPVKHHSKKNFLSEIVKELKAMNIEDLTSAGLTGIEIARALKERHIQLITSLIGKS